MASTDLATAAADFSTANEASERNQALIADLERRLQEAREQQTAIEKSVKEHHASLMQASKGVAAK